MWLWIEYEVADWTGELSTPCGTQQNCGLTCLQDY